MPASQRVLSRARCRTTPSSYVNHQLSISSNAYQSRILHDRPTTIPLARLTIRPNRASPTCVRRLSASAVLTPPLVFAGLVLTLWTWKCMMMVIFQNKIIYMPNVPPFARAERMEDYLPTCGPVKWEQRQIKSLDGTKLAICCGSISPSSRMDDDRDPSPSTSDEVTIVYFHGNGGSLPPRMPLLSAVLRSVVAQPGANSSRFTLFALSPRGYWHSSGRATQPGIELDAQALLNHIASHYGPDARLILWGQSIGAGVATAAAATYLTQSHTTKPRVAGLVLETPFTSIRNMLAALYPQKWLPYRYLWPFLRSSWDSKAALRKIANVKRRPSILLLPASRDEVVPAEEAEKLERICRDLGFEYERTDVLGALHNEASMKRTGQVAIARFVVEASKRPKL